MNFPVFFKGKACKLEKFLRLLRRKVTDVHDSISTGCKSKPS